MRSILTVLTECEIKSLTDVHSSAIVIRLMPVTWTFRGGILILRLLGHHVLTESQQAVSEALTDPRFSLATSLFN
jgi:hypothetical protein